MMRRVELEARRRALLARCEAQRAEIAWRIGQLSSGGWARAAASAAAGGGRSRRHPLAWLVAIAGVLLLRNPRSALLLLGRARSVLTWITRAVEVLGLLGALRKTAFRRSRRAQQSVS
jgi:hypothetical protein